MQKLRRKRKEDEFKRNINNVRGYRSCWIVFWGNNNIFYLGFTKNLRVNF